MLPGCKDIQKVGDVPDAWVDLYRRDVMDAVTHLYEGDIDDYLDGQDNQWRNWATLVNVGSHWAVDLNRGQQGPLRVTTVADGSCGAHAAHAVLNAQAILAAPASATNYAAPPHAISAIRGAVRDSLSDADIRTRILGEVNEADNVFETGFGPLLMDAIQRLNPAYDPDGQDVDDALADWGLDSNLTVNGAMGLQFTARHSRGAPYVKAGPSSSMVDNPNKMESYASWMREINASGVDEKLIAKYLRAKNKDELYSLTQLLSSQEQVFAASMLWSTVNLAEEWRKTGAAKVFRALMRAVEAGETDLDTAVMDGFRFRASADEGRTQVGLVQDHLAGVGEPSEEAVAEANARVPRGQKLTIEKKRKRDATKRKSKPIQRAWAVTVVKYISDGESDLSSDDETAARRTLKKKRKLSAKHAEDSQ